MSQKNKAMKFSLAQMIIYSIIIAFVFLAICGIIQRIFNQ